MDWLSRQTERLGATRAAPALAPASRYRESILGLDPITGLANRRLFQFQGEKALSLAHRHAADLGLVVFRIENLDDIALAAGMPVARALLRQVGSELDDNCRACDTGGRLSRSRFGVLLPGSREFGAHKYAVRMLARLQAAAEQSCSISAAAVATGSRECTHFTEMEEFARNRLDQAVAAGGNRLISGFCQ